MGHMQSLHSGDLCNTVEIYVKIRMGRCRFSTSFLSFSAGMSKPIWRVSFLVQANGIPETIGRCSCFVLVHQKSNKTGWAGRYMRIIGIDPGLRTLGWGVIDSRGNKLSHVACGICQPQGADLAGRLLNLHQMLSEVLAAYAPDEAAVEQTFVNKDGAGTLKLGQARGIAMLVPAQAGLPVGEYAPNTVKKTVVGVGHADKRQVAHMVRLQLPGSNPDSPDAADALAIAICHAFHGGTRGPVLREVWA